jgi:hypothetical protein
VVEDQEQLEVELRVKIHKVFSKQKNKWKKEKGNMKLEKEI